MAQNTSIALDTPWKRGEWKYLESVSTDLGYISIETMVGECPADQVPDWVSFDQRLTFEYTDLVFRLIVPYLRCDCGKFNCSQALMGAWIKHDGDIFKVKVDVECLISPCYDRQYVRDALEQARGVAMCAVYGYAEGMLDVVQAFYKALGLRGLPERRSLLDLTQ